MPLDGRTISSARTSSRKPSPGLPMVVPRMTTEEATPNTQGHARSASAGCSKPRLAPRLEAVRLRCAESAAGRAVELDGPTVQPADGCRPPALRTDLPRDVLAQGTPPLPVRGTEQGKGSPAFASSRTTPGTGDSLPAVCPVKSRPAHLFQHPRGRQRPASETTGVRLSGWARHGHGVRAGRRPFWRGGRQSFFVVTL